MQKHCYRNDCGFRGLGFRVYGCKGLGFWGLGYRGLVGFLGIRAQGVLQHLLGVLPVY